MIIFYIVNSISLEVGQVMTIENLNINIMKTSGLLFIILFLGNLFIAQSQSTIQNPTGRKTKSLNGHWQTLADQFSKSPWEKARKVYEDWTPEKRWERVEYAFTNLQRLHVPGDWNTQNDEFYYYEGSMWYKQEFDYNLEKGKKLFVYFEGANYKAKVFLNGKLIGEHKGGFTPFHFDITKDILKENNKLIVCVNNERKSTNIPAMDFDWWNYGGITRNVYLLEVNNNYIQDYKIQLDQDDKNKIIGNISTSVGLKDVKIRIPELNKVEILRTKNGKAGFEFIAENIEYWSPDNPKLYRIELINNHDTLVDHIGFRTIKTDGNKILLNGEEIYLKGISIHEEAPYKTGRITNKNEIETLFSWAKELGCNYVRLAHYPHNEFTVKLADKMGLMVWSEVPLWQNINFNSEKTKAFATQFVDDMLARDKNRAAIIIWCIANETRISEERNKFLTSLVDRIHENDPGRLVAAALHKQIVDEHTVNVHDPLGDALDIIGMNEYLGWYTGKPTEFHKVSWQTSYPDKPHLISEFGAGAKQGFHGDSLTVWTEEYQEFIYKQQIKMLKDIDFVKGMSPWILMDFRSPGRFLNGIQDDFNRKGIISETGIKKKAFYVLQNYYRKRE